MRILGDVYVSLGGVDSRQLTVDDYSQVWHDAGLDDESFTTTNFPPGSTGEAKLVEQLRGALRIYKTHHGTPR
jgi:hypothetical protein